MGDYNCFSCLGQNRECIEQRRYTPYANEEYCINKEIAKLDENRLRTGDLEAIKLRDMLSQHLFNIGRRDEALRLLPAF